MGQISTCKVGTKSKNFKRDEEIGYHTAGNPVKTRAGNIFRRRLSTPDLRN